MAEPTLAELAELLRPFQEERVWHIPLIRNEEDGRFYFDFEHPDVRMIIELAEQVLITEGRPDRAAMQELTRLCGVTVGPGDHDSFGWLTGCVHTNSGTIVYG